MIRMLLSTRGVLIFAVTCTWEIFPIASSSELEQRAAAVIGKRCVSCHNANEKEAGLDLSQSAAALKGGESGPSLVAGNVAASLLWQRVAADEMPPEKPLSDEERECLKSWIESGAKWPAAGIDPFAFTSESRAGYDWWSLQPLAQPELRYVPGSRSHPIDEFVDRRLAKVGLKRSPPADRRSLIRRLYVDLHGLLPTPDEIEVLLTDSRPDAITRLIDHLLAADEYGQRWGRHWLDLARFGESQGFERDKLRTNAWRYRDWVVNAFNNDLPYDEFARMQLAGDVLRPGDAQALIATGFLVAAPYDEVGKKQQSLAMRAVVRQDELEDLVSVVTQTFLGLTANCARCHDHKFDPILQREYYQLTAALAGVQHGEPSIAKLTGREELNALLSTYDARTSELQQQIELIDAEVRARILDKRLKAERPQSGATLPKPIAHWSFDGNAQDEQGSLHVELRDRAQIKDGALLLNGQAYAVTAALQVDLREKTLEAWVKLDQADQSGGSAISVESLDGKVFDGIVFGEQTPGRWMAGSNNYVRTQPLDGPEERDAQERFVHMAIVYEANGQISAYRDGQLYGKSYRSPSVAEFKAGQSHVLLGLRHSPVMPTRLLRGSIDRASLYDQALSPAQVAASAGVESNYVSEAEILASLSNQVGELRGQIRFELEQLAEHRRRVSDAKVYAVAAAEPEETFVLLRGNPGTPGPPVGAGGIASIEGVTSDFELPLDASDAERRRCLADWITDQHNPLFARVIVNRLWHHHFGVGLVDTPNDFGFNGGRPSHPELLDWLAAELIRGNWSLKHIQRCILTSATYQQSSLFRAEAGRVDQDNRLLWRMSPKRLDAETLRDVLLEFAGKLDRQSGGPGFYEFTTYVHNSQFYDQRDAMGSTFERRALYRTWVRSARSSFLDAFDCPDPSTKAPQRAVTTTPLQALALLNNSFVLRMADSLAERAQHAQQSQAASGSTEAQLAFVLRETFGRDASDQEMNDYVEFVNRTSLAAFCRAVFNSNELLYID